MSATRNTPRSVMTWWPITAVSAFLDTSAPLASITLMTASLSHVRMMESAGTVSTSTSASVLLASEGLIVRRILMTVSQTRAKITGNALTASISTSAAVLRVSEGETVKRT